MKIKTGPSLYYASDKNIFDALTRSKVKSETIQELFLARNIIVSSKTDREDLASYFSRLPHDLLDHHSIAMHLGINGRKERLTSVEVELAINEEQIVKLIGTVKANLEAEGDVLHPTHKKGRVELNIKYSTIDYRKSEFSQVQIRDGVISIITTKTGFVLRSTHNDFINNVRDSLIFEAGKLTGKNPRRKSISLFTVTDPTRRSEYFHSLMFKMPDFTVKDVHEVYVFKARPEMDPDDEGSDDAPESHVDRVLLRGNGVTHSKELSNLIKKKDGEVPYYIVRVAWVAEEKKGLGRRYEIEARFEDSKDCNGFSFMLRSVYPVDVLRGGLQKTKRAPTPSEVDEISSVIEAHSNRVYSEIIK